MSRRQWHSILPPGAFSSSALAEDLEPVLEQSGFFGKKHILFAAQDCEAGHFPRIEQSIREKGLRPQRYISLDEFAVWGGLAEQLARGFHFAVIVDREPSAAAIERMATTKPYLDFLTYVVIGRKDWRFKDALRSLPYFVRSRLCLDFPVSIHSADPFHSPAELTAILAELKESSGFSAPPCFSPHFGLRRELLRANVIAVSGPEDAHGPAPVVSLVVTDPETMNRLITVGDLQKFGSQIEIVLARVIGQEANPVRATSVPVSHVWLHLEEPSAQYPEIEAHLRNWGARYARGKTLIFPDAEPSPLVAEILDRVLSGEETEPSLSRAGVGAVMAARGFREAGGYDPLYCYFNLGDPELLHRYTGGLDLEGKHAQLAEYLRGKIRGAYRGLAVALFHHQYFDQAFFRFFSPTSAESIEAGKEAGLQLRNQFRYRMEQSRDAYLGIYKASPRVALDGHIQILLKPYHWVKPHAWLLKMPVYPLFVTPYHWIKPYVWRLKMPVYPLLVKPYHFLRQNVWPLIPGNIWKLKMPVYPLLVKPYHFLRENVWPLIPGNIWKLKMPVYPLFVTPYHFLRQHVWRVFKQNVWKLKFIYYFLKVCAFRLWGNMLRLKGLLLRAKGQLWRVKQIYHFIFWLLFPIRKVYYFAEYQFEKRVLGLYGRQHVWIRK